MVWPPCPVPFNLAAHVLQAGGAVDDRIALVVAGLTGAERWSYGRLRAAVRGAGGLLLARGLRPGDRVLMRLGNSPLFPVLYLGAIAVGVVPVVTAAALTSREVTAMVAGLGVALVVADPGVSLPDLPDVPVLDSAALRGAADLPPADWDMGAPDRLAYVLFTSGTTGGALPVAHAHRAVWARGMMREGWQGLQASDRLLHAGAMNWSFTLGVGLLDPWAAGATALVAPGVTVAQMPLIARRLDATILAGAPGVFRQMLRAGLPALPRLRHGLVAGESLQPALRRDWQEATGCDLHEAFGMSEVSTYLSGSPARPAPEGAMGWPQPGRRVALLDGAGAVIRGEGEGEIAVDAGDPGLMLGYLGRGDATAARYLGPWFRTGDRACRDASGAFYPRGRGDDLMNAGGFRVAPVEVEAWMAACPGVQDLAVAEVEVRPGVRVIGCFYVAEIPLDDAELTAHAARGLADWKCPRLYRRVAALPRRGNGKLDRRALPLLPFEE